MSSCVFPLPEMMIKLDSKKKAVQNIENKEKFTNMVHIT